MAPVTPSCRYRSLGPMKRSTEADEVRLNEYTKDEFRDIMRIASASLGRPLDEEQFEKDWADFVKMKRRRSLS